MKTQLKGQRNRFTENRSDRKRHMKLLFAIKCSMRASPPGK